MRLKRVPVDDDPQVTRRAMTSSGSIAARRPRTEAGPGPGAEVSNRAMGRLLGRLSSGEPLPMSVRARFEPRLGASLGDVRLHTGAKASELARTAQAEALTIGSDVLLPRGIGGHAPDVLAHELVHTLQGTGPWSRTSEPVITQRDEPLEREAAALGRQALTREGPVGSIHRGLRPGRVGRQALEPSPPTAEAPAALRRYGPDGTAALVPDLTIPGPGQMVESMFLEQARAALNAAGEAMLRAEGLDAGEQNLGWVTFTSSRSASDR